MSAFTIHGYHSGPIPKGHSWLTVERTFPAEPTKGEIDQFLTFDFIDAEKSARDRVVGLG